MYPRWRNLEMTGVSFDQSLIEADQYDTVRAPRSPCGRITQAKKKG